MVGLSSGIAKLVVSAVVGGIGLPFGVPPAPEDATMGRVAPETCLFYVSWAGTVAPDLKSPNQTEQMLAEPEVQNFLKQVGTALQAQIQKALIENGAGDKNVQAMGKDAFELLQHVSMHPGAVFVGGPKNMDNLRAILKKAKDEENSSGKEGDKSAKGEKGAIKKGSKETMAEFQRVIESDFDGGIVLSLAPDAAAWNARLKKDVEAVNQLIAEKKDKLQVVSDGGNDWHCVLPEKTSLPLVKDEAFIRPSIGVHGDYLIVALCDKSYKGIVARMTKEPPQWWSDIPKRLPIDRRSVTIYVDLRGWADIVRLVLTESEASQLHDFQVAMEMLGLSNARAWVEVWGLDGHDFANKSLLWCDGEPVGLMRLISDQPLKPEDLSPIPSDAIAAAAFRFDAQQAMEIVLAALEKMDPKQKAEALAAIEQTEKSLGIDLRHGALKSLGDTWCLYSSPGEGYWPTAVVSLRDWAGMNLAYGRLMALGKQFAPESNKPQVGSSEMSQARLEQFRFADNDVYCLNCGSFAPSWCMTKREMVFGLTPQTVKAYLTHDQRHEPIQRQPAVADLFAKVNNPTAIGYFDSTPLFRAIYGIYGPLCSPTMTNALRAAGFEADMSLMPSAPSLYRHIGPSTTTLRRTKHGIEFASHGSLPMPSMTGYFVLVGGASIANGMSRPYTVRSAAAEAVPSGVAAQPADPYYVAPPPQPTDKDESKNKPKDKPKDNRPAEKAPGYGGG